MSTMHREGARGKLPKTRGDRERRSASISYIDLMCCNGSFDMPLQLDKRIERPQDSMEVHMGSGIEEHQPVKPEKKPAKAVSANDRKRWMPLETYNDPYDLLHRRAENDLRNVGAWTRTYTAHTGAKQTEPRDR